MKLSQDDFIRTVRDTPLVAIDLIMKDKDGNILVGLRKNEPARGYWFVPGGRIRKDELLRDAFLRLTKEEIGRELPKESFTFLGIYEHMYANNAAGDASCSTHYIVLAFQAVLAERPAELPPDQHSQFRWLREDELLHDDKVHTYTKAFFEKDRSRNRKHPVLP